MRIRVLHQIKRQTSQKKDKEAKTTSLTLFISHTQKKDIKNKAPQLESKINLADERRYRLIENIIE